MKKAMFLAILAVSTLISPLVAQQEGAVAIAGNIRATDESAIFTDFSGCVANLVKSGTKEKDARRDCKDLAKIAANTAKRIANESADATKASRPLVITNGYGSSYGYGRSYSYSRPIRRTVVVTPQRRAPVRVAPQAKPRPAVSRQSASPARRVATPVRRASVRSLRSR